MSAIKNAIPVLILLLTAFSSGGGCAQSDDTQGGYILVIDLDTSSSTDYWLGFYGSVIPASESPHYLDNRTRIQAINVSWMGGCLLITDSQIIPDIGHLTAGSPAMIDAITGTGYDSGSRTFKATENYSIYDRLLPAPTAYTFVNCSESRYFKEGFFTEPDKDNLVFIVPVIENGTCYNDMPCNFQFILPNNPASPKIYKIYQIPPIPPVTKPSAISLTAYPGIIKADGIKASTITAIVRDKSGRVVNWTEVTFSTTLGEITPHITEAKNGTTNATLTSSTSPGTAVVKGAIATIASVYGTVYVPFIKTAEAGCNGTLEGVAVTVPRTGVSVADTVVTIEDGIVTINTTGENASIIAGNATAGMVISVPVTGGALEITLKDDAIAVAGTSTGNISKIQLNTSPEEYMTSQTDVGTVSVDIDVDFYRMVTLYRCLSFNTTLVERYSDLKYLNVSDPFRLTETLATYFGVDTSTIANNTPIMVYAQLSMTNFTRSDVAGVPISITLNKTWFDTVAGGDPDNIVLFKINETTGELEGNITMTQESTNITGDRVTFRATFEHFSLFAIVAGPASIQHGGGGGDGTYPPVNAMSTFMSASAPAPVEPAMVAAEMPMRKPAGAAPEEQPGRDEWPYLIPALLLAIAAGIFLIVILRRSRDDEDDNDSHG
ncbi:MAG: Ig-like domain-containing protein [Euryarchaeota archaeon]|nr:Ig-like domain-containing protein [Euryarchaeota archaeon]